MAFTRFIQAATEDGEIEVFGDGLQSRDFTYVDDAVSATIAAAERGRPGEAYNVAGGAQATVLEVIELLGELLGRGRAGAAPSARAGGRSPHRRGHARRRVAISPTFRERG